MRGEGPELDHLTHRLADCPKALFEGVQVGKKDGIHVDAVVHDLILALGGDALTARQRSSFVAASDQDIRRLETVLVAAWLLHEAWFREAGCYAEAAANWLQHGLDKVAKLVTPRDFVDDPDRREELARLCLQALDLRPAGESPAQAEDRIRTLDTISRDALIRATKAKQERARKLREQMEAKAAREAAARANREW